MPGISRNDDFMTYMKWSRQFSFDDPFHFAADVAKALALHAQLAQRW